MKRCPQCGREYDTSMMFCLDDGAELLYGPGTGASPEPATAILNHSQPPSNGDARTRTFANASPDVNSTPNSIAVLPFTNIGRDEDAEYLSDGIAEELLNVLSKIDGLRVAGRTSSFSFKGKQTTFKDIGKLLNVSSVLEGSVRAAGKRIRISVQLVNIADGFSLWSETYDRTMDDIFEIQDDVAKSVVEELRSRLIDQTVPPDLSSRVAVEVAGAAQGRAADPEAHRLMLLGRHLIARATPKDLTKAVECFERSLEIDPTNAPCLVELGLVHTIRASNGFVPYARGFADALISTERALALEPNLASAHAVLARLKVSYVLDFDGAEASISRALEIAPNDTLVLRSACTVIRSWRPSEALEFGRKAVALDPLNGPTLNAVCVAAYLAGKMEEAEVAGRRSIEVAPENISSHTFLALALCESGRVEEARVEAAAEPSALWSLWSTATVECASGETDTGQKALDDLILKFSDEAAFQIAEIYAAMGRINEAFETLNRAIGKDSGISQILVSRHLRPLHSDSRWEPLLTKIGIPKKYWPSA